jgi:hypothetical protein
MFVTAGGVVTVAGRRAAESHHGGALTRRSTSAGRVRRASIRRGSAQRSGRRARRYGHGMGRNGSLSTKRLVSVTRATESADFPTTPGAFDTTHRAADSSATPSSPCSSFAARQPAGLFGLHRRRRIRHQQHRRGPDPHGRRARDPPVSVTPDAFSGRSTASGTFIVRIDPAGARLGTEPSSEAVGTITSAAGLRLRSTAQE